MKENEYYKKVGDYYDEDATDFDKRYWANPLLQKIRQSFREEVKKHPFNNILEIGCGTGIDVLHFCKTHPDKKIYGIDVSPEMVRISDLKLQKENIKNGQVKVGSVEHINELFPGIKFDMIYVFFGALNTVESLKKAADSLKELLNPDGTMVLTFVNKYYIGGIFFELIKLKFRRAFARIKPVWGGYSPVKYLPSKCYSVNRIKKTFLAFKTVKLKGYCIFHPAWYYININKRLGKLGKLLWKSDEIANKTPLKRFGEYTLFVLKQN